MFTNFWLLMKQRRDFIRKLDIALDKKKKSVVIDELKREITRLAVRLGDWLHPKN